MIQILEKKRAT